MEMTRKRRTMTQPVFGRAFVEAAMAVAERNDWMAVSCGAATKREERDGRSGCWVQAWVWIDDREASVDGREAA